MKENVQVKKPPIIKCTKKKKLRKSPYFTNNSNITTIRKIRRYHQPAINIKRKFTTTIQGYHHEEINYINNNDDKFTNKIRYHNHVSCSQYFPPRIVYNSTINNRNNYMMSLVNCLSNRLPSEITIKKCSYNKKNMTKSKKIEHHRSPCRNISESNEKLYESLSYIIESISSSVICNICKVKLSLAIEHFNECSIFRNTIKTLLLNEIQLTNSDNDPRNPTTCCRYNILIEEYIQYSVRHICSNLCYLRAFAPFREWIQLHQWILNQQLLDDQHYHSNNLYNNGKKIKIEFDHLQRIFDDDWCCLLLLPEKMKCDDDECCVSDDSTVPLLYKDTATLDSLNIIIETSAVKRNVLLPKIVFYNESKNIVCTSRQNLLKELLLSSLVHHHQDYYHQSSSVHFISPERNANNSNPSVITCGSPEKTLRICPSSHETKISPSSLSNHSTTSVTLCQSFINKQNMGHDLKPIKSISSSYHYQATAVTNSPFGLIEELFINNPWKLFICTILLNRTCRYQIDTILDIFLKNWPAPETLLLQQLIEKQHKNKDNNDNEVNDISSTLLYKSLSEVLRPLGINNKRAYGIIRFTNEFLNLLMMKTKQNESIIIKEEVTLKSQLSNNINNKINFIMPFQQQQEYHQMSFNLTRKEILSLYGCGEYAADAYQIFIQCNIHIKPNDTYLCNYIDYQRSCI